MGMQQHIKLETGHKVTLKNKYGYNLFVFNGTVKGKEGYFVKLDKKTFGPFFKIIKEKTKPDEDVFLICMANAIKGYVVRIGIKGFEVVEKLDFSGEVAKTLDRMTISEGTSQNVQKLGTAGKYAVYQTGAGQLFAELRGEPIKPISQYELFDSYIELHIDNLLNNNDNSFYDVGAEFSQYSPEIFRKVWVSARQKGDSSLDEDGIHRRNATMDEARCAAQIIAILKSKFTMEELYAFKDCKVWSLNSDRIVDIKKFNEIDLNPFIQVDYHGDMWFSSTNLNKALYGAMPTIPTGEFIILLDGKMYILKDNALVDMSNQYLLRSDAYKLIVEKAEKLRKKKQDELTKNVKKLAFGFTRAQLDFLDFWCLQYINSHRAYELMPKGVCIDYTKNCSVNEINQKMMSQASKEYNDNRVFFKHWYALLNTKTDFVGAVKSFVDQLRAQHPNEAKAILCHRANVLEYLQTCYPTNESASCYFSGKSLEQLEERKAHFLSFIKKKGDNYDR